MEIWKDIPDYEGIYQVSNLGNVRSLRFNKIKLLKPQWNKGYYQSFLYKKGARKCFKVHVLVAITFLNHIRTGTSAGIVVDHKDNNTKNNRLENLQLLTNRENSSKKKRKYTSSFTGVSIRRNKWVAQIQIKGKQTYLGIFNCETSAMIAYQKKLATL